MASPTKHKATIYDVAARAGVAISTVSRVLNRSSDVSEATRARVSAAIDELQFRPDRTAKNLAYKTAQSLCVALPSFTTPFHNEFLKGVRQALRHAKFDLMLSDLGSTEPQETLHRFLERGSVDGLLIVGMPVDDRLAVELHALRAPVVLVGYAHPDFDAFVWEDEVGAYEATRHLLGRGHRRIGMIRPHSDSTFLDARLLGYRRALQDAGLPFDPSLVQAGQTTKHAGFSEEAGAEALAALLDAAPDVTAVFATADVLALGALSEARERGRRVPDDLAIIGYDDVKVSRYVGLSSVDQMINELGQRATNRLVARVTREETGPAVVETVTPRLVPRASTLG